MEVFKEDFEYFAPQILETSVNRSFYIEYMPVSAFQHGLPIQFIVPSSSSIYLSLNKSYIYVRAKITLPNGNDIAPGDEVGPINLPLHSLFRNIEIELNGKSISDSNPMYPYRAYLETLLGNENDTQNTVLESAIWNKDTPGNFANFHTANNSPNSGLVSHATFFRQSAEVEMMGRPHCDIFQSRNAIPPDISLRLRLIPSTDEFLLVCPNGGPNYRFQIIDIRFCVYCLEGSNQLILAHNQALSSANVRIPLKKIAMKHLTIPPGVQSTLYDNVYQGVIPSIVIVALVTDAAMSGGYQENPFHFHHFNVNHICICVNGEQFPSKDFQPNFANNIYLKEYNSIFEGLGIHSSNDSVSITRSSYPHGYTLFVFNLKPDPHSSIGISPTRNGNLRLDIKFAQAIAQAVNIILYATFESVLEIDKYHNIIGPS